MTPSVDRVNWPTMAEAAVRLGTNERTIRRWIDAGKLRPEERPAPGRKPLVIVDPEDVGRLQAERQPPVVMREERAGSNDTANPNSMALAPFVPANAASLQHFLAGVSHAYPVSRTKPWLTLDEAAEFSGLPRGWLLAQARRGEASVPSVMAINVGTEKQPRWRFNREALSL